MRLKRSVSEYLMPRGMVDYCESFVKVGPTYFNICHINIKDINSMPSRSGKLLGIPAYIARFQRNDREWIKLYPAPEKSWTLTIRYTQMETI